MQFKNLPASYIKGEPYKKYFLKVNATYGGTQ
jgi:hypothetical protein